jgi:hypothetical protein
MMRSHLHSRRRALVFTLGSVVLVSAGFAQEPPERLIVGKWRFDTLIRNVDGTPVAPQAADGKTFVEFTPKGTWTSVTPDNRSSGTYRWLDAQRIEQTTLASGITRQIGMVSTRQVRVDADRLELVTVQTRAEIDKYTPPLKTSEKRPNQVIVTAVFSRAKTPA